MPTLRTCWLLIVALVAPLTPTVASAQTLAEACATVSRITVGQWAEYRVTAPDMGRDPITMRMAIVGTEQVEGTEHFWQEMQMTGQQGRMIMQMLVPGYPFANDGIKGMVMKVGDQPAMRMPERMVSMMMRRAGGGGGFVRETAARCDGAELVGTESVTTPAGTFDAMHLRATGEHQADIWVSLDIPFGIVQMRSPEGAAMDLMAYGTDATSAITETPVTMPGG